MLVARARSAGLETEYAVEGEARCLPPSLDMTAYRIVQEALTNVLKHAPGATASVQVTWLPTALELAVRNDVPRRPALPLYRDGHGLIGMRERVRIHGGTLTAGHGPDDGFEVVARLPTEEGLA